MGINKGKICNNKGELILCTLDEFEEDLEFNNDDLVNDRAYSGQCEDDDDDKLNSIVSFYLPEYYGSLLHNLVDIR